MNIMSKEEIKRINQSLLNGEIPNELNYCLNIHHKLDNIDWRKVQYNNYYQSYDFAASKFPDGYDSIPGFEKVIESCIPKITPLEEMLSRSNNLESNNILENGQSTSNISRQ